MDTRIYKTNNFFAIASLIFGVLALLSLCTGIFPLPLGALSIIFAVLSKRKGKQLDTLALSGIVTSVSGMAMSLVLIIMSCMMLPDLLADDSFMDYMNNTYESIYGISFEDFVEDAYGVELDEILGE